MANHNISLNTASNTSSINIASNAKITSGVSSNSGYYSNYYADTQTENNKAYQKSNNVELHLLNGQKIMLKIDWEKVYNLKELRKKTLKFTKKFPFLHISSFPYTTFKYRVNYTYINSPLDPRYNVDCPLSAFMSLIGINYEKFEDAVVEDAIKNGS